MYNWRDEIMDKMNITDLQNSILTEEDAIDLQLKIEADKKKEDRKNTPVYSGVLKYFPLAISEVAKCSMAGQKQHNPDKPLAWDRAKSGDELDALMRHLSDHSVNPIDDDGQLHLAKIAWRALAALQKHLEGEKV